MTENTHDYDGTGRLGNALASLYGLSPKSQGQITKHIKQAKDHLGIDTKAKVLPDAMKRAVYRWHVERLHPATGNGGAVELCSQAESTENHPHDRHVEIDSQAGQAEPVEIISHGEANQSVEMFSQNKQSGNVELCSQAGVQDTLADSVEIISQDKAGKTVEIDSHGGNKSVEIFSQAEPVSPVELCSQSDNAVPVEIDSQPAHSKSVETFSQPEPSEAVEINSRYGDNALVRVAFHTTSQGVKKRQVIALDGFYLNALLSAAGIGKADVPKWVQTAVDGWAAFDPALPITKQVKRLIVNRLIAHA